MRDGLYTAIGLMSGTSLDGIDAAILVTDGEVVSEFGPAISTAYDEEFRKSLKAGLAIAPDMVASFTDKPESLAEETEHFLEDGFDFPDLGLERQLTEAHSGAVHALLKEAGLGPQDIDVIGFHGQTLYHAPEKGFTWQMGDAARLAEYAKIDVVSDFRGNDITAGGEGAPLAPVYHVAAIRGRTPHKRVIVLNLGGVANLTWIDFTEDPPQMVAFDTGPGNALIDDWIYQLTGRPYDEGGKVARRGRIDPERVFNAMAHSYFARPPPKSLDRNAFSLEMADGLDLEDGAATLTGFTVAAVEAGCALLPEAPEACYVSGGGRHNPVLMTGLRTTLSLPVEPVEAIGLRGDSLEAELMAFLAVRSLRGLPLTFPETTGAKAPATGGRLFRVPGYM